MTDRLQNYRAPPASTVCNGQGLPGVTITIEPPNVGTHTQTDIEYSTVQESGTVWVGYVPPLPRARMGRNTNELLSVIQSNHVQYLLQCCQRHGMLASWWLVRLLSPSTPFSFLVRRGRDVLLSVPHDRSSHPPSSSFLAAVLDSAKRNKKVIWL